MVSLKKKMPSLKIILSLGGWGGCKTCSTVFSTDSGRQEFVASVVQLSDYFHTDGIDLDWEFPSMAAFPEHPFLAEDKANLTMLVHLLRDRLGNKKEISVICYGTSPYLEGSIDLVGITPYVNRIHLMTYDLIGSKAHYSGHQSNLYSTKRQTASADHALRYLDSLKIPHEKISIGIAFYARQYRVLVNKDHGLYQPADFEKFVTMKQIRKNFTDELGYTTYWDKEAQAAYKYNELNQVFLTYDDERSIASKISYVKEKHLDGIFFWELRLDRSTNGLLDVIHKNLRK